MKKATRSFKSLFRRLGAVIGALALISVTHTASAQSVGFNVVPGDISTNNATADSLLPEEIAGVPSLGTLSGVQSNWNNISGSGNGTFAMLNGTGGTNSFYLAWDTGYTDTTGTGAGLATPDGKLMDEFMVSWGPGNASPLASTVGGSGINDKPLVFISGLNSWYTGLPGAEGYAVVLYTTGNSYYETSEGYLESVTGSSSNSTMVEGSDLTPHLFNQVTQSYLGTYIPVTSTDLNNPTGGGNYMFFTGFTNDSLLIRLQCHGYGAGLNGWQFIPVFPSAPAASTPTFNPASPVLALTPVTVTETAAGDPFHPQLWYKWYSDNGTGGAVTNVVPGATNSTLLVTPTNNAVPYAIQYVCMVSNIFGASNSPIATLTVNPGQAPGVATDTTPGPGSGQATVYAYAGGSISFTCAFNGSPSTYLWQSNSVDIPGTTSTTLTLNNLPLSATAGYSCTATNAFGSAATTPASLVVLADPSAPGAGVAAAHDLSTNNPVAYWRFSETADNAANFVQAYDYSGNGHNANYGVAAFDNQPGPQAPALPGFESTNTCVALLNNTANSFLTVPSLNLNTNTVTISAWINPTGAVGANWGLFMWRGANGDAAGLGFGGTVSTNNVAELGYTWNSNSPSSYGYNSGLYPPLNQWSFVTLVITPTTSTIYLYYVDTIANTTNLLKSVQNIANQAESFNGGTICIGSDNENIGRTFNGSIDEMAVFNKSLSESQVQDLFLKALGVTGIVPQPSAPTVYPTATVYSGQNVILTATVSGTAPLSLQWQSSPDNTTWTNVPGANDYTAVVNPLTVGTAYYRLSASNPLGMGAGPSAAVTFTALPATPAGLWTVNYQVTNNVLNYTTGNGIGHYTGRGILGTGSYWNVLPDTAGAFGYIWQLTSASDLRDDGGTHSGIYASVYGGSSGFGSSTAVQTNSSDIGNLLYQWVTSLNTNNSLQFYGVPDGTYNVCFYGCDGYFNDRGTTFVVHDALNGDQTNGTVNASPILPLQQGVNFVVMSHVHVAGGTLNVDIKPTTPVPSHDPNGEADFNGAQLQLVSYDVPPPNVILSLGTSTNGAGGTTMNLYWPEGILQTATNLNGPWTNIYQLSPVSMPVVTTNPAQFFRVKVE